MGQAEDRRKRLGSYKVTPKEAAANPKERGRVKKIASKLHPSDVNSLLDLSKTTNSDPTDVFIGVISSPGVFQKTRKGRLHFGKSSDWSGKTIPEILRKTKEIYKDQHKKVGPMRKIPGGR